MLFVVPTVRFEDETVVLIDQRLLPAREVYLRLSDYHDVAAAIRDMAVRGAPAIGVTAAFGIALGVRASKAEGAALRAELDAICELFRATRPTAVNLFWAIERMRRRFTSCRPLAATPCAMGSCSRRNGSTTRTSRRAAGSATWAPICYRIRPAS